MGKFRLTAIAEDHVTKLNYKNSGVIFHLKPLPFKVKRDIINESSTLLTKSTRLTDVAGMAMKCIKYGIHDWENLQYEDETEARPKFEKCEHYHVKCLKDESVELLARTSAYDDLATMIREPKLIEAFIEESIELKKKEEIVEELDTPGKKSQRTRKTTAS